MFTLGTVQPFCCVQDVHTHNVGKFGLNNESNLVFVWGLSSSSLTVLHPLFFALNVQVHEINIIHMRLLSLTCTCITNNMHF